MKEASEYELSPAMDSSWSPASIATTLEGGGGDPTSHRPSEVAVPGSVPGEIFFSHIYIYILLYIYIIIYIYMVKMFFDGSDSLLEPGTDFFFFLQWLQNTGYERSSPSCVHWWHLRAIYVLGYTHKLQKSVCNHCRPH